MHTIQNASQDSDSGCLFRSKVIQEQWESAPSTGHVIVYYFCDYAEPKSLQPSNVYRAILKQLFVQGILNEHLTGEIVEAFQRNAHGPHERQLAAFLLRGVKESQGVHILVDGLDECPEDAQRSIIELLLHLASLDLPSIKVLVTSREEERPLGYLQAFEQMHLSTSTSAHDIESFVSDTIETTLDSGEMTIRDMRLKDEVVSKLVAKAQGMYVKQSV